jgi:hypothetical protein
VHDTIVTGHTVGRIYKRNVSCAKLINHNMKTYRTVQLWPDSYPGRFTPRERASGAHFMDPRSGTEAVGRKKSLSQRGNEPKFFDRSVHGLITILNGLHRFTIVGHAAYINEMCSSKEVDYER